MKNKIYIILIGLLVLCSCNDYENVPVEYYTDEYLFSRTDSLGDAARKYLNSVYHTLENGHNRVGGDYLDAASDDAISASISESDAYRLAIGSYTASTRIDADMGWGDYYMAIMRANRFINNVDVVPFRDKYENHVDPAVPFARILKAEARFLRALYYFELLKRYGGIPLMGNKYYNTIESVEFERNPFDECVEYIVTELDAIQDSLRAAPVTNLSAFGHVPTVGSAKALKSRVLLYAASPLFNGSTVEKDNELVGYIDYDAKRWERAANAAAELIDEWGPEGKNAYGLVDNFKNVFLEYSNKEVIFHVQGGTNTNVERKNGPVGFSGASLGDGATSPTQNLVDAFPMLDGKLRGESKYSYDDRTMYENRDPRLNYTILYNGAHWLSSSLETYVGGKNNPTGSTLQKTKTSYYMRKFMGNFENAQQYSNVTHNWVMFRYAEILLNYAEAQNEYELATNGAATIVNSKVLQYIRDIRKRAGIEEGGGTYGIEDNTTCEEMRTIIRNERRIEMGFEEQRYWDIRRWKIAEDVFSKPLKGLILVMRAGRLEPPVQVDVQSGTFDPKRYLYPIPYKEVNKNSNMVQNPGWK